MSVFFFSGKCLLLSTTSQILTVPQILGVRAKNLEETQLFVDLYKAFDSIHRGKMELILLTYSLPKETVASIMTLYKNTNVKVCSPDGDRDYFYIVAGVLQEDTFAPYLFIICRVNVLWTSIDLMKENGFTLANEKKQKIPHTNYYGRRLRWWLSTSGEYTCLGRGSASLSGTGSRSHRPPCERRKNRIHML